jgi:isoquinoline 1-oxidoreductase beta subunit
MVAASISAERVPYFHQYTPLRMGDMPEIDIHLIENNYYPVGAGEPALSVVAPAIANAIAKAAGARVRGLPITPEKIKDAKLFYTTWN